MITAVVSMPLNNALAAAGSPDNPASLATARVAFEATWVRWNLARTVASTVGFGCLICALVQYRWVSA